MDNVEREVDRFAECLYCNVRLEVNSRPYSSGRGLTVVRRLSGGLENVRRYTFFAGSVTTIFPACPMGSSKRTDPCLAILSSNTGYRKMRDGDEVATGRPDEMELRSRAHAANLGSFVVSSHARATHALRRVSVPNNA